MFFKGFILLIGCQILLLPSGTHCQAECGDKQSDVEQKVRQLLAQLSGNVPSITSNCEQSVKDAIDCSTHVKPSIDGLNDLGVSGQCLSYAAEFFDTERGENPSLVVQCSYEVIAELCGDTVILKAAVDGAWSDWGAWSTCTDSSQTRTRECNNPPASNDGNDCSGDPSENQDCGVEPTDQTATTEEGNNAEADCLVPFCGTCESPLSCSTGKCFEGYDDNEVTFGFCDAETACLVPECKTCENPISCKECEDPDQEIEYTFGSLCTQNACLVPNCDTCEENDPISCKKCNGNYTITEHSMGNLCTETPCLVPNCETCESENPYSCEVCNDKDQRTEHTFDSIRFCYSNGAESVSQKLYVVLTAVVFVTLRILSTY